ncbi:unnamed protein product [Ambrosiozyma monospora]|uniref:Unnamed protein product n=1 Tax=Ambrosiozyma monospora TaxID=43982 RepID=A0A9W6T807_AMBMO|nr:unnamed protein product [Ambrosiozyma monospora]
MLLVLEFFNPVYYKPSSLSDSLASFFKDSDLFILEREDGKLTLKEQNEYITKIGAGELDQVPKEWAKNIFVGRSSHDTVAISSSEIRKMIVDGDDGWEDKTFAGVAEYIRKEKCYL